MRTTLGEFTGQNDINGTPIYEGVKMEFLPIGDTETKQGEIVFQNGQFLIKENDEKFYRIYDDLFGNPKVVGNNGYQTV